MVEKIVEINTESQQRTVDSGNLILLYNRGKQNGKSHPILGVFADLIDDVHFCLAEQPYTLQSVVLPSGISFPQFHPITPTRHSWNGGTREIGGWRYNFNTRTILDIVNGKDNILDRLRTDPEGRYKGHVDVIAKMEKPYVNDAIILGRLG